MAMECEKIINMAIRSFINKDLELAKEVLIMDNSIDEYFVNIREELIDIMASGNQERASDTYLMFM